MIIKLIANTLLSVFMDKKARGAFDFYKETRTEEKKSISNLNASKISLQPASTQQKLQASDHQIQTTANAKNISNDTTHQLIINSLEAAKLEINAKPKITKNRKALINEAIKLQNSKKYILDNLSEDQRQKLKSMALFMLKGEFSPPIESKKKIQKKKK